MRRRGRLTVVLAASLVFGAPVLAGTTVVLDSDPTKVRLKDTLVTPNQVADEPRELP
jgi:hypothetical protein